MDISIPNTVFFSYNVKMNRFSLIYMRSRLESYLFTYATTNIVQEIIKQTSIQVQIFITMNLNMNNNNNNVHLSVIMII